jgi:hypothetical protein
MVVHGWWRLSVSCKNRDSLEKIQKKVEEMTGEKHSFNEIITLLIQVYRREERDVKLRPFRMLVPIAKLFI